MLGAVAALAIGAAPASAAFTPGAAGLGDPFFPRAGNGGYDVAHYDIDLNYIPANEPPRRDHDDQGHRHPGPERLRPRLPRASDHRAHRRRRPRPLRASRSGARGHAAGRHPQRRGVHGEGGLPRHTAVDHRPGWLDGGLGAHQRRRVRRRRAAGLAHLVPVQRPPDGQGDLRDLDHRPAGDAGDLERRAARTHAEQAQARAPPPRHASTQGGRHGDVGLRLVAADGDLPRDRDRRRLHDRPQARRRARITRRRRPDGGAPGPREPDARPDRPASSPSSTGSSARTRSTRPARSSTTRRRSATRWRPRRARSSTGRPTRSPSPTRSLTSGSATRSASSAGRTCGSTRGSRPGPSGAGARSRAAVRPPSSSPASSCQPASRTDLWDPPANAIPDASELFATSVYTRGAMALEALRQRVGDATFYDILRTWAAEHAYLNANTAEFIALAEAEVGPAARRPLHQVPVQAGQAVGAPRSASGTSRQLISRAGSQDHGGDGAARGGL